MYQQLSNQAVKRKLFTFGAVSALFLLATSAQAALVDRGGGLLYDNVLNVTWLQDANYAKTSGYDADGLMNWPEANTWANNLVYGGYNDWRLATNTPVNGVDWNLTSEIEHYNDGTSDWGYNITSPHNELAYMYYVNLGLKGYYDTTGNVDPTFGVFGNGTTNGVDLNSNGEANVGLVQNLQAFLYWSEAKDPYVNEPFIFHADYGWQGSNNQYIQAFAWAVHPGDIAAVPEPETYAMLLIGLGLVGTVARRRKQQTA